MLMNVRCSESTVTSSVSGVSSIGGPFVLALASARLHKCRKFCTLTVRQPIQNGNDFDAAGGAFTPLQVSFLIVVLCIFILTYLRHGI